MKPSTPPEKGGPEPRGLKPVWLGGELVSAEAYQERARAARLRAERLGLTKTWMARQVGRRRPHVSAVLHGRTQGPGTLRLIEVLLDQVEAGKVTPKQTRR